MKCSRLTIFLLILLSSLLVAQSYDLQFIIDQNDQTVGGIFEIRIQIKANNSPFALGTGNLVFSYNATALNQNVVLTPLNFSGLVSSTPLIEYNMMEIEEPIAGVKSVNMVYNTDSDIGQTVPLSWMDVASIAFTINEASSTDLQWRTSSPNRINVFDSNETSPSEIASGTFFDQTDVSLPVELVSFEAHVEGKEVTLQWVTESEVNNLGFEVMRSFEETVGYEMLSSYQDNPDLVGQGNSNNRHEYIYRDESVDLGRTYWYKIRDVDYNGNKHEHPPIKTTVEAVAIPTDFKLSQNYPNPFNPDTRIEFGVPERVNQAHIRIDIYNTLGETVRNLINENFEPGYHYAVWDGRNDQGQYLGSGIYYYVLRSNDWFGAKKMILIR